MYFKLGQPPDQIVIPFGVLKAEIWNQIHLLKLNPGKGPRLRVFYTYFKKHAHATLIMPFVRTVKGGDAAYFGYAFTQYCPFFNYPLDLQGWKESLKKGEFVPYYQPQIDIETNQIKEQQELLVSLQEQVDTFVLRTFPTLG